MRVSLVSDEDELGEPLSLIDVKRQVRLEVNESHPDDTLIENLIIPAARDRAEIATSRPLRETTWDLKLDAFPCDGWIELPKSPVIEVVSITYVDTAGTSQTWAADQYQVDLPAGPKPPRGRITPAWGVSWPSARSQMNAVTVRIRAGYDASDGPACPALLKVAMLSHAGTLYEHREEIVADPMARQSVVIPTLATAIYRSFRSVPRKRW